MSVECAVQQVILDSRVCIIHFLEVQDLETEGTTHTDAQIPVLVTEGIVEVEVVCRNTITQNLTVSISSIACIVVELLAVFIETFYQPLSVCAQTYRLQTEEVTDRRTYLYTVSILLDRFTSMTIHEPVCRHRELIVRDRLQFILVSRIRNIGIPFKVLSLYRNSVDQHFKTDVADFSNVGHDRTVLVRRRWYRIVPQTVLSVTDIEVDGTTEATAEHIEVNTDVVFVFLFPTEVRVFITNRTQSVNPSTVVQEVTAVVQRSQRVIWRTDVDTGDTETGTYLQVIQPSQVLHEFFVVQTPTDRSTRESTPFVVGTELRRTFATYRNHQQVAVVVVPSCTGKETNQCIVCLIRTHTSSTVLDTVTGFKCIVCIRVCREILIVCVEVFRHFVFVVVTDDSTYSVLADYLLPVSCQFHQVVDIVAGRTACITICTTFCSTWVVLSFVVTAQRALTLASVHGLQSQIFVRSVSQATGETDVTVLVHTVHFVQQ